MAQGYSQEDFAKMQQQAINRVREMQRQSKINETKGERIFREESKSIPDEKREESQTVPHEKPPERIFEPERKETFRSPPPITRVHTGKSRPAVSSFLEMDSDVALILPLLLLLQRDGADEMLILALLYIMA